MLLFKLFYILEGNFSSSYLPQKKEEEYRNVIKLSYVL
jgi:hypothetical protein